MLRVRVTAGASNKEEDDDDAFASQTSKSLVPEGWAVPQAFRDRLGTRVGRQRMMSSDGHLLLILHEPPAADDDERHGRLFWRDSNGAWLAHGLGSGSASLAKHVEEYHEIVERAGELEEDASGAQEYFEVVRTISPIFRAAGNLHRTLQEARDAAPEDRDLIDARDRAYDIQRNADLLFGLAKEALEFEVALQSEQLARNSYRMSASSHRLNLLAAFFFPLATLSSVFGMNLPSQVESWQPPVPFLLTLVGGLAIGAFLFTIVARGGPRSGHASPSKPPRY